MSVTLDSEEVLDVDAVAEARATMLDKFPRLVSFFLEDTESYIGKIEEALSAQSAQLMVPPSHTLKSSARQMGAAKMADVAMHLETEARKAMNAQGSIAHLAPDVVMLKALLGRTRSAFEKYLG